VSPEGERCPRNRLVRRGGRRREAGHLTLPLAQVADAYRAMDERRAIKALLVV
jgi:hypothetical protein